MLGELESAQGPASQSPGINSIDKLESHDFYFKAFFLENLEVAFKISGTARAVGCFWCSAGRQDQSPTSSEPASLTSGFRWRSEGGTRRREGTPRSGTGGPPSPRRQTARGPTTAGSLQGSWDVCCRPTVHSGWTSPGGGGKPNESQGWGTNAPYGRSLQKSVDLQHYLGHSWKSISAGRRWPQWRSRSPIKPSPGSPSSPEARLASRRWAWAWAAGS